MSMRRARFFPRIPKREPLWREGSVVRVTVSSGPETVYANVPAGIVGASQSEAEQAIRAAGLVPQAQNASSDSVEIGYVISVDPGEGAQVEEGSSVYDRGQHRTGGNAGAGSNSQNSGSHRMEPGGGHLGFGRPGT